MNTFLINHICLYLPSFGDGGVERMATNLAFGFSDLGIKVDFIVDQKNAPYIEILEGKVNFITPATGKGEHEWLCEYLNKNKPQVLMTVKDPAGFASIKAIKATGVNTLMIPRTGTALKSRFKHRGVNLIKRWTRMRKLKRFYKQADGHIAVAEGTKKELQEIIQIPGDMIKVIKNPVITPALLQQQDDVIDHPWFSDNSSPLIIGMGGFRQQKDFATLIKAVAEVRKKMPCRLLLLGQGRQQERLKLLANELGFANDIDFPGFTQNPYPWLKRADLFVLSSLWEGSPNVITEALALGTPVVSTDCQSGPREILQNGRFGILVPVKDSDAMAKAIITTLDNPLSKEELQYAAADYRVEVSCNSYIKAFESFLRARS
jgi:glycosyltransferase involved in cell wall biosynthesis